MPRIRRNDIGKSSILEALDIFLDGGTFELDEADLCRSADGSCVRIGCTFDVAPDAPDAPVVLDDSSPTTLADEYLLNEDGRLEIIKEWDCGASKLAPKVFVRAYHPGVDAYAPNKLYTGGTEFRRHLFPRVGDFDSGSEYKCAVHLDAHPRVDCWIRNLSGRPRHSFALQTATDRFYPDFVGRLKDGRVFVVEVKGADRWELPDSAEKRTVGALWQEASGGRCVFVMPRGEDWGPVDAAFGAV